MLYAENCFCRISSMSLLALPKHQRKQLSFPGTTNTWLQRIGSRTNLPSAIINISDNMCNIKWRIQRSPEKRNASILVLLQRLCTCSKQSSGGYNIKTHNVFKLLRSRKIIAGRLESRFLSKFLNKKQT